MMKENKINLLWGILRLSMGWIFFWAFIDKFLGLGFSTKPENAWISGGSPTFGFLKFATKGPFAQFYQQLAGNALIDWFFMLGLLFVGITLLTGILVKLGSYTGIIILFLIYTAGSILPEHNPFLDEHIIYILVMLGLSLTNSGQFLGFGKWWSQCKIVQRHPFLN